MAQEFECSIRSIDQDIQYLKEDMQLPIEFDRFKGGYVNTNPNQKLPEFDLNFGEVLALTIGKDMLAEYSGTSLEPILKSAFDKIADRLPEKIRMNLGDFVTAVRFKPTGIAPISRKVFFDFAEACDAQRVVQIEYFSASTGQNSSRQIEPLRVVENRGAWYCVAWCRLRQDVRMFALHRVQEYKLLDETFTPREDVDVDAYLSDAFLLEHGDPSQRYVIWFEPSAAPYVRERQWHHSQELTEHLDGSLTISFDATRMDEVKRWVLGYGASARVLEPAELRELVRAEFERGIANYKQPHVQLQLPLAAQTKKETASRKVSTYRDKKCGN
jgi:predicted DNA-binding transcriptional regulator YafY